MPPNELNIGDDEDARANMARLIPKQPIKSYHKFLENDGKIMRFYAHMVDGMGFNLLDRVIDADRR